MGWAVRIIGTFLTSATLAKIAQGVQNNAVNPNVRRLRPRHALCRSAQPDGPTPG